MIFPIAITPDLCYTGRCLDRRTRGVNPIRVSVSTTVTPKFVWVGACILTLTHLNKSGGFCVMRLCSKCQEWKSPDEFGKGSCKDGLSGWCKPCAQKYNEARRQSPEYQERHRVWDREHKRKQRLDPDYAKANREADKERAKLLRQDEEYKQRQNEYRRNRRKNDPDYRTREKNKEYQRRALTKDGFTPQEWNELCSKYGNICLCCKEQKPLTPDHVIPLSKGGANTIDNLQPLCLSCNSRKRAETTDYRNG